jgi:hypothetical protein
MNWFKRAPSKHPQEIRVPHVRFVGEQDGPSERLLKERLIEFFKRDQSVNVAYLAQIEVEGQMGVALCLKTQFGTDRGMAEKVGAVFKTIFNAQVHLDIMFPNANQDAELVRVCRPFFVVFAPDMKLQPHEMELVGKWITENDRVRGDPA